MEYTEFQFYHTYAILIHGDKKVSVHLMTTMQSSGGQRLFDHPLFTNSVFINLLFSYFRK